jgi:dihydroneopterin aldolase
MTSDDLILIEGLELAVHIGVPDEERAAAQVLRADIEMRPGMRFEEMGDEIAKTIDYDAAARRMRALAAERPRRLIETLAAEMVGELIAGFGAVWVRVTLRKRILPGTDAVAVRLERHR